MKIFMIWGQRECQYPGQHAPELLQTVDEYTDDDNPKLLESEEEKYRKSRNFKSICIIQADIDDGVITRALSVTEAELTDVKPIE